MDIDKLEIYHVGVPLQFPNGNFRPLAEYDDAKGPILYRAHAEVYGDDYVMGVRVWLSSYPILRYTACGVWIGQGIMADKFVNLRAEKQWACITKAKAVYHLTHRKRRHMEILAHKHDCAKLVYDHLKQGAI